MWLIWVVIISYSYAATNTTIPQKQLTTKNNLNSKDTSLKIKDFTKSIETTTECTKKTPNQQPKIPTNLTKPSNEKPNLKTKVGARNVWDQTTGKDVLDKYALDLEKSLDELFKLSDFGEIITAKAAITSSSENSQNKSTGILAVRSEKDELNPPPVSTNKSFENEKYETNASRKRPENIEEIILDAKDYHLADDLQISSSDSQTCELDSTERSHIENLFPFIVMEPLTKMHGSDSSEYNIWCEGIMISNSWGLAPPKCFIETDDITASAKNDYYLTVNEENSTTSRTYKATLQIFVPDTLLFVKRADVFCNYIGLFKILNFSFNFKKLIPLPQKHFHGDLVEHTKIEECKIVGALFFENSIRFRAGSFPLMDVRKHCAQYPACAAAVCVFYNHNVTYIELNLPRSRAEIGCRFDIGYQWGTSLICLDSSDVWYYYGMSTSETKVSCGSSGGTSQSGGYQAFTRVDAYLDWIQSTVVANGGWNPV